MDSDTVNSIIARAPYGLTSHFEKSPAGYDTIEILKLTFNETTGIPIPQNELDRAYIQIQTVLNATQWTHKQLLNYEVSTINSFSDPTWQNFFNAPRNGDNVSFTRFSDNGSLNDIQLSNDGTFRIYSSSSQYTTGNPNSQILSEFFSSITNQEDAFGSVNLANFITTSTNGGILTDLGKHLVGISHVFKAGSYYSQ